MGAFERWSYAHLGQWHYVLGYSIVLVSHNWPLLVSIGMCIWFGQRLYRSPTRARVCWFYAALLFGLAYEYNKHVAPILHRSLDTIIGAELIALNLPAHFIVEPVMSLVLYSLTAFFGWRAFWLTTKRRTVCISALDGDRR